MRAQFPSDPDRGQAQSDDEDDEPQFDHLLGQPGKEPEFGRIADGDPGVGTLVGDREGKTRHPAWNVFRVMNRTPGTLLIMGSTISEESRPISVRFS